MKEIDRVLEQVQKHIADEKTLDPVWKKQWAELERNIRAMNSVKNHGAQADLVALDRHARELAAEFDIHYPHISSLIRRLSDMLQNMGL